MGLPGVGFALAPWLERESSGCGTPSNAGGGHRATAALQGRTETRKQGVSRALGLLDSGPGFLCSGAVRIDAVLFAAETRSSDPPRLRRRKRRSPCVARQRGCVFRSAGALRRDRVQARRGRWQGRLSASATRGVAVCAVPDRASRNSRLYY